MSYNPIWNKTKKIEKAKNACNCDWCNQPIEKGELLIIETLNKLNHCSEECWLESTQEIDGEIEERDGWISEMYS